MEPIHRCSPHPMQGLLFELQAHPKLTLSYQSSNSIRTFSIMKNLLLSPARSLVADSRWSSSPFGIWLLYRSFIIRCMDIPAGCLGRYVTPECTSYVDAHGAFCQTSFRRIGSVERAGISTCWVPTFAEGRQVKNTVEMEVSLLYYLFLDLAGFPI